MFISVKMRIFYFDIAGSFHPMAGKWSKVVVCHVGYGMLPEYSPEYLATDLAPSCKAA